MGLAAQLPAAAWGRLTGPGAPASDTKSGAHKSPAGLRPPRPLGAAASRGSPGGPQAKQGQPWLCRVGGPPGPSSPGAWRPWALDSRSASSFQPGPRLPAAASAPGGEAAPQPAWPGVAKTGRTREVWGGSQVGRGQMRSSSLRAGSVASGRIPRERKLTTLPHGVPGARL